MPETLETLIDRQAIRDVIMRVARGEDRRNEGLLRSAYWPEARIDFGVMAGGFDDYLTWCVPGSPMIPVTQHMLGQTLIALHDDNAKAETYVQSYHRVVAEGGERDTAMGGRYLDVLEKRDGEWRIAARTMLYDWDRDLGVAADWSKGLMGMPFAGEHYTGQSVGDFSEGFFG
ncbi:nuclear transport factor 2 family protein [Sphingomonas sp. SUN039]|uniref:nuclear transport factor 2 family protein n=1 Tax=Sphingomonas sp. SUN039 TaxID=2937787 RepID=UPI00216489C6|nr:nuclear transport factor 2 family protein [Sphingomonas sp. SUN039]UVO52623.1 nuclear transport factor 2 family protein [Sphingomonas sp. SUN039]